MVSKDFDQIHISVYGEIVNGKYYPNLLRFNSPDILRNLVIEANTIIATVLPASENPKEYIENTDFLAYGYKNVKDYDIEIRPLINGKHEIILKPKKVYDLHEVIDIPQFASLKCNSFLDFMGDEFERIKVRAEWVLEHINDDRTLAAYANRHVQKAKKMFYEAKQVLRESQKDKNAEDIYVLFVLNLFIVRTILFYQKLFRPYINLAPDKEEQMVHEIMKELSLREICALFHREKLNYSENIKRSFMEMAWDSRSNRHKAPIRISETNSNEKSSQSLRGAETYERIKVNGQINVLVDVFIQMLEEIEVSEGMFLETTRENLEAFLVANFKDKNDKAFSPYTIHTILKPYRIDKHIKKESPRKIDLSKRMKKR